MKEEFKIATSVVGGYNKKDTDLYMMQLYKIIKEQQDEVNQLKQDQAMMEKKLTEAKNSYSELWEKCEHQEDVIALKEELAQAQDMIAKQKEMLKSQRKNREQQAIGGKGNVWKKTEGIIGKIGKSIKRK